MKERRVSDYTSLRQLATRQAVLLRGLDLRKLWNAMGLLYEYLTWRTVLKHRPVVVRMEPTSHCNLRCPTCHPFGNTFGGAMSPAAYAELLDRLPLDYLLKGTLYLFGEPFFNRHLHEMIGALESRGVPTGTSTNFNIFNEKKADELIDAGLSWIIVCVDGADQATYETYRVGGRLDRVLKNIEILVAAKRRRQTAHPIIEVQCIEFDHNRHQIDDIRELCRKLGVERFTVKRDALSQMNIDFTQVRYEVTDPQGAVRAGPSESRDDDPPAPPASGRRRARCVYLYGTVHVDYDGSVLPCCVGRSVFGNLRDSTFDEIWNNEMFVAARRFFASGFTEKAAHLDIPCYTCPLFFPEVGDQADRVERVRNQ